jgi:hypothetical protein
VFLATKEFRWFDRGAEWILQVATSLYAAIHIYRQHEVGMTKQTLRVFAALAVNAP